MGKRWSFRKPFANAPEARIPRLVPHWWGGGAGGQGSMKFQAAVQVKGVGN
jgi:hypothetical protein